MSKNENRGTISGCLYLVLLAIIAVIGGAFLNRSTLAIVMAVFNFIYVAILCIMLEQDD